MALHQLVHTLNYGDAISGEALLIQRLMRERGEESRIYCVYAHEKVRDAATPWTAYQSPPAHEGTRDVLLLHYSLGSPLNELFRGAHGVTRVLLYHNLTPERWFTAFNARVASDLRQGHAELPELAHAADLLLADSSFNAAELAQAALRHSGPGNSGTAPEVGVLPLAFDPVRWSMPANPGIAAVLRGHGGRNFLHVGRLAPNKCVEDIIKAFYFYHHKIDRESRLWLVGIDIDTELYSFELRRLVSELRLKESVSFVGAPSDGELRAFYENADLYLSMSEHEGFCLPLVEAMYFGVPVIAYDACAVAETVDGAGLLLARKSPAEVAELASVLVRDTALRERLIAAGKRRVGELSAELFTAKLVRLLLEPAARAGAARPVPTAAAGRRVAV